MAAPESQNSEFDPSCRAFPSEPEPEARGGPPAEFARICARLFGRARIQNPLCAGARIRSLLTEECNGWQNLQAVHRDARIQNPRLPRLDSRFTRKQGIRIRRARNWLVIVDAESAAELSLEFSAEFRGEFRAEECNDSLTCQNFLAVRPPDFEGSQGQNFRRSEYQNWRCSIMCELCN